MSIAAMYSPAHFSTAVRWILRVLSWTAFGVSAYLAWHAINQSSVAGCGVGSELGCDAVLSSSWSRWLGLPIAVAGLACYATLASLSVLLDWPMRASRWITTVFTMMAIMALAASLWFIGVQVFAIGRFCPYCIVTDLCGITIGALSIWSMIHWRASSVGSRDVYRSAPGMMALRSALPAGARSTPALVPRTPLTASLSKPPSRLIAMSGAMAFVILLIGGQLLFPGKTYEVRQVALEKPIDMDDPQSKEGDKTEESSTAKEVTAMRIPTDSDPNGEKGSSTTATPPGDPATNAPPKAEGSTETPKPDAEPEVPRKQRLVKFFNGKLTLDVYKHPLLGSPEAPHIVVEMVSYDCPHCRKMSHLIQQARDRYGDQVAVLVMVIPMERSCNKFVTTAAGSHQGACATAKMVLGLATLKPAAFERFHEWMMEDQDKPPDVDRVVSRVYQTVDPDKLRELSRSEQLSKQVQGYINLFGSLGAQSGQSTFGLPVQILGDRVVSGEVEKAEDVFKAWEEHLGVKPKEAAPQ